MKHGNCVFCVLIFITFIFNAQSNSLDECELYIGGDFVVAGENSLSSSFLKYDLSANEFTTNFGAGVFLDTNMDNMFYSNGHLFLSGDIVRFNTTNSVAVGSYNFTSRQLEGAGGGIWTQSKTTPNFENSPSLLFGKYQNQLIIAGHFEKLPSNVMIRTYNNIVIFNSETGTYSEFPQNGISMSEKSVNGLEYDVNTDSIFISTISETGSNSELFCFQNGTWIQLSNPPPQNSHTLTILFNSLHLSGDSLFALAYYSITGSLSDSSVSFYLLSWNLATLLDQPLVVSIWQKSCGDGKAYYPTISQYPNSTILISIPSSPCPTTSTMVEFKVYSGLLVETENDISNLMNFQSSRFLQTTTTGDIFVANEINVSFFRLSSKSWETVMQNAASSIKSLYFSSLSSELYIGYALLGTGSSIIHVDYCPYQAFSTSHVLRYNLFNSALYKNGQINTITELPNSLVMIGGNYKYIENGNSLLNSKLATIWNGTGWMPSLSKNSDSYLPGWSLLSAASTGSSVYAIADAGNVLLNDSLPVLRWNSDNSWLYLYNRPRIYSNTTYDPSYATVYIDPINGDVYFGGNFTVRYTTSPNHYNISSGVIVYNIENETWRGLPVNLTSVRSIVPMDNRQLLQIGGTFKFSITDAEGNIISCQNFAIYNISSNSFLPSIPASPANAVYSISLFPGQSKYSFVGGVYGSNGVEQLRYVGGVWSWSLFGNTPLPPTVYSLASRNEGNVLFAGGSFESMISKFDIPSQQWTGLLSSADELWSGQVNSVYIICPFDNLYEDYQSEWGETSMLGSLYSQPECVVPPGVSPSDYVCPATPLTTVQIFGICATIAVTVVIVGVIGVFGFFAYKDYKKAASVEFI